MNNNIQEDYCSFEVSKLLKEKGCTVNCNKYSYKGVEHVTFYHNDSFFPDRVYIPTHALAIKWIRENYGIHIWLENNAFGYYWKTNNSSNPKFWSSDFRAFQGSTDMNTIHPPEKEYKEPEIATEAALLYTLENLIK